MTSLRRCSSASLHLLAGVSLPQALVALCLIGCAASSPGEGLRELQPTDLATTDALPSPDLGCTLGSPDHCGSCGAACPGVDDATSQRSCGGGSCGLTCRGEHYDVDGDPENGCELEDPAHEGLAQAEAVALADAVVVGGACTNTNNGCTVVRAIASDARVHETAPVDRPLGRSDWFRLTVNGAGGAGTTKACLSISNGDWPVDNSYEVCISAVGATALTSCATAMARMSGVCVQPSGNTDAGVYYVRVEKLAGAATGLGYALYLEH